MELSSLQDMFRQMDQKRKASKAPAGVQKQQQIEDQEVSKVKEAQEEENEEKEKEKEEKEKAAKEKEAKEKEEKEKEAKEAKERKKEEKKKKKEEKKKKDKRKKPKKGEITYFISKEAICINIASVHQHYEITDSKVLSNHMIYTLHSWMDTEVNTSVLCTQLHNKLLSQDLSIQGGFLCASVMLVHAQSPTTFPNPADLLAQHYYHARETYIIVYCPNFITASAVLTAYSPQLTLLFNYDCNIHMCTHSNHQASTPTSSTFYSLIFCNTTPAGSSKSTKWPALIWDYTSPLPEYEAKTAPLQKQGYINIHPIPTFIINTLLTQDEATIPASQLIKSQLDAPPPVFFAHLLCLFTPCEGFVVNINSTSPWPAIGAI